MPRPVITTAAIAPIKLPTTRPRLLLITPPTVGKLTTAAELIAQYGESSCSTKASQSDRHMARALRRA